VTVWFEKKLGLGGEADMGVGTKTDYVRVPTKRQAVLS